MVGLGEDNLGTRRIKSETTQLSIFYPSHCNKRQLISIVDKIRIQLTISADSWWGKSTEKGLKSNVRDSQS